MFYLHGKYLFSLPSTLSFGETGLGVGCFNTSLTRVVMLELVYEVDWAVAMLEFIGETFKLS